MSLPFLNYEEREKEGRERQMSGRDMTDDIQTQQSWGSLVPSMPIETILSKLMAPVALMKANEGLLPCK